MANGDIAAARGWTLNAGTDDRRQGWDRINYALDRAAEQANRLDTVEAAVNQPIFSAYQGTAINRIPFGAWTPAIASWYATPDLNDGFTSWAAGQLKIKKSGVYRLDAHLAASATDIPFDSIAVQIIRNGGQPDSADTMAKDEISSGGPRGSVTASAMRRLVAGDVLQVWSFQRSSKDGTTYTQSVVGGTYNFTFSAEWRRS